MSIIARCGRRCAFTYNGDAVVVNVGSLVQFLLCCRQVVNNAGSQGGVPRSGCIKRKVGHTELGVLAVRPAAQWRLVLIYDNTDDNRHQKGIEEHSLNTARVQGSLVNVA